MRDGPTWGAASTAVWRASCGGSESSFETVLPGSPTACRSSEMGFYLRVLSLVPLMRPGMLGVDVGDVREPHPPSWTRMNGSTCSYGAPREGSASRRRTNPRVEVRRPRLDGGYGSGVWSHLRRILGQSARPESNRGIGASGEEVGSVRSLACMRSGPPPHRGTDRAPAGRANPRPAHMPDRGQARPRSERFRPRCW